VEGGDKKVQRSKEKRVIQHNLNEGNETETKKQHSAMTIIQTNTQKRKKEKEKKRKDNGHQAEDTKRNTVDAYWSLNRDHLHERKASEEVKRKQQFRP